MPATRRSWIKSVAFRSFCDKNASKKMPTLKQCVTALYIALCVGIVSTFLHFIIYIRKHRRQAFESTDHLLVDIMSQTHQRFKQSATAVKDPPFPQSIDDIKVGSILLTQPWPFDALGFVDRVKRIKPSTVNVVNAAQPIATHCSVVVKIDKELAAAGASILDCIIILDQCQNACILTTLAKSMEHTLRHGEDLYVLQFNKEIPAECVKHFWSQLGDFKEVKYGYEHIFYSVMPRYDKDYSTTPTRSDTSRSRRKAEQSRMAEDDAAVAVVKAKTKSLIQRNMQSDKNEEIDSSMLWLGAITAKQTCSSLVYALLEHANFVLIFKPKKLWFMTTEGSNLNPLCSRIWHPLQVSPADFLSVQFQYVDDVMPQSVNRIVV